MKEKKEKKKREKKKLGMASDNNQSINFVSFWLEIQHEHIFFSKGYPIPRIHNQLFKYCRPEANILDSFLWLRF